MLGENPNLDSAEFPMLMFFLFFFGGNWFLMISSIYYIIYPRIVLLLSILGQRWATHFFRQTFPDQLYVVKIA